ncbi:MAG TPA: hypothetical protein VEK08_26050 [Planctomycetota bacterium]|nr:hypothetical protein [Planctomycetota bacterium]
MINWGKDDIHPTIHLARCREGSDDLRFAVTIYNRAMKSKETPEGKAALEFLEGINQKIGPGRRETLQHFGDDVIA